jgi:hypothetical protein
MRLLPLPMPDAYPLLARFHQLLVLQLSLQFPEPTAANLAGKAGECTDNSGAADTVLSGLNLRRWCVAQPEHRPNPPAALW